MLFCSTLLAAQRWHTNDLDRSGWTPRRPKLEDQRITVAVQPLPAKEIAVGDDGIGQGMVTKSRGSGNHIPAGRKSPHRLVRPAAAGGASRTRAVPLSGIDDAAGRAPALTHDSAVTDGGESAIADTCGATGTSTTTLDPSCAVRNSGTVRGSPLLVGINGPARNTVSVPHTTLSQSMERRTTSTRRFCARPSAVAFGAIGRDFPSLAQAIREESRPPACTRN